MSGRCFETNDQEYVESTGVTHLTSCKTPSIENKLNDNPTSHHTVPKQVHTRYYLVRENP